MTDQHQYSTQPRGRSLITLPSPQPEPVHEQCTIQSVQDATSPAPPQPQRTPSSDIQLRDVAATNLLMNKQTPKFRSLTSTKQARQDLRFGPRPKYLPCVGCDATFDRPSALRLVCILFAFVSNPC